MAVPTNPSSGIRPQRRLECGYALLDHWSTGASQFERNAVYKALFAVLEGTVWATHIVLEDPSRVDHFGVLVRQDLVLDIRIHGADRFTLAGIGAPGCAGAGHVEPS